MGQGSPPAPYTAASSHRALPAPGPPQAWAPPRHPRPSPRGSPPAPSPPSLAPWAKPPSIKLETPGAPPARSHVPLPSSGPRSACPPFAGLRGARCPEAPGSPHRKTAQAWRLQLHPMSLGESPSRTVARTSLALPSLTPESLPYIPQVRWWAPQAALPRPLHLRGERARARNGAPQLPLPSPGLCVP